VSENMTESDRRGNAVHHAVGTFDSALHGRRPTTLGRPTASPQRLVPVELLRETHARNMPQLLFDTDGFLSRWAERD